MINNTVFDQLSPQNLSDAHQEIRSGDILLCSGSGVISSMIKKATDSIFSHVGLILQLSITKEWLVLESVESFGVRCVPLHEGYMENYRNTGRAYPGRMLIARHKKIASKNHLLALLYQFAFSLMGDKYSREDIFKIATRIALNEIGVHESGVVMENNRYICSEYLYACYKAIGITLPYNALGFIAPASIANSVDVIPVAHLTTTGRTVIPEPSATSSKSTATGIVASEPLINY